jgi:hypothetical protein
MTPPALTVSASDAIQAAVHQMVHSNAALTSAGVDRLDDVSLESVARATLLEVSAAAHVGDVFRALAAVGGPADMAAMRALLRATIAAQRRPGNLTARDEDDGA